MLRSSCRLLPLLVLVSLAGPARAQTGLVPLIDLGAGTHGGFPGGLYPGSLNTPPPAHLSDAMTLASAIVPRDAAGNPSPNGWIGMIAVGMSNTTHEFAAFERNADQDPTRNARVVIVDTGQGGQTATLIAPPTAPYWTTMTNRLTAMGLTAQQVQVAWLKEAEAGPPNNFPLHAQALRDTLKKVVRNLHDKFPNLKIVYCSSRIYGGYAPQGGLNPEPQAYESGFSVKWLIEDQINGDPNLNYGHFPGPIRAPLLMWGPYLWADGTTPRSDGLTWLASDMEADNVHPSFAGEQKVAGLLAAFFAAEPTAAAWWPAVYGETLVTIDALHDAHVSAAAPTTNFGAATLLTEQGGAQPINIYLRFDASGETRPIRLAKLSLRVSAGGGGLVRRVNDTSWTEGSITWNTAPAFGATMVSIPQASRDGTADANVTADVTGDADRHLSYALTLPAVQPGTLVSKEGGEAPRLVLVVTTATAGVLDPATTTAHLSASPNPTTGATRIAYALDQPGLVDIRIVDVNGRLVRGLLAADRPAGASILDWDGRADDGAPAAAGLYFVRLALANRVTTQKLVLAR
jgi:hypothetical protein